MDLYLLATIHAVNRFMIIGQYALHGIIYPQVSIGIRHRISVINP
jgi:hypothetical protein